MSCRRTLKKDFIVILKIIIMEGKRQSLQKKKGFEIFTKKLFVTMMAMGEAANLGSYEKSVKRISGKPE